MRKLLVLVIVAIVLGLSLPAAALEAVKLPEPATAGGKGINDVIQGRRSVRSFAPAPITLPELSQLLWSAQGVTEPGKDLRAAPSARGSYPLVVYAVVREGGVTDLPGGLYRYQPQDHSLTSLKRGDFYPRILDAARFFNRWLKDTSVTFVIAERRGLLQKLSGETARLFADLEGGMATENLLLQAAALGLGACPAGSFSDKKLDIFLESDKGLRMLLMVGVGHPE